MSDPIKPPTWAIPLTRGMVALVDEADYAFLTQWKWYASIVGDGVVYAVRSYMINKRKHHLSMHRAIMAASSGQEVDHRNHDTLDNRRDNLRLCPHQKNRANTKLPRHNTTGFKGVYVETGPRRKTVGWRACLTAKGVHYRLGCFATPVEAARAYDAGAVAHFGEFAMTNKQLGLYA